MKFILAKKIGMSQVFDEEGKVHPVTLLEAGPVQVTQVRTKERDNYQAVQVEFDGKRREFRTEELFEVGDKIDVSIFNKGDVVNIVGWTKGRGFQGVVKRHGFGGGPQTHGTKHSHRAPGSIGATNPQRVIKGRRMAGHMGTNRVTVKNLKVIDIDREKNTLLVEGAIPGARGSLVMVKTK